MSHPDRSETCWYAAVSRRILRMPGRAANRFAMRSSTASFSQRLMRRQRPPVQRALMVQAAQAAGLENWIDTWPRATER